MTSQPSRFNLPRLSAGALAAALVACLTSACSSIAAPPAATTPLGHLALPAGYALVWSDEFNTDGLPDPQKWVHDTDRNKAGWHNHELQYYADKRAENVVVKNGTLRITARQEDLPQMSDWGGQHYSSARLLTRGKGDWRYGYVEVRAKLPCGKGTWPAIWMLGSGGRWPEDGEIDIMEQVGSKPSRVFSTVHMAAGFGGTGKGADVQVPDACTAFHTYQLLWTASQMRFGIDGRTHYVYDNLKTGAAAWPFDAPQFLLLNLAIGGDLGGPVDDSAFPMTFEVDFVRVYQPKP